MPDKQATIPKELLDILVCPVDLGKVHLKGDRLVCEQCGRAYPILDGVIPIMLEEEAEVAGK